MGPIQQRITDKLRDNLPVEHLQVINESNMHNVPPGSESHFKITLVSDAFNGKSLIAQHRMINAILKEELEHDIHALALHTYTPEQWQQASGITPESPPCLGGDR